MSSRKVKALKEKLIQISKLARDNDLEEEEEQINKILDEVDNLDDTTVNKLDGLAYIPRSTRRSGNDLQSIKKLVEYIKKIIPRENDTEEDEEKEKDSSDILRECIVNKNEEYKTLINNSLINVVPYITSLSQETIKKELDCGNINMWINFNNLFQYELTQVPSSSSSYNYENAKTAFMNMLFKLDSVHDFFGERTKFDSKNELNDFKQNILGVLGWNNNVDIKDTVDNIIKGHFENDLFMWLILYGLRFIGYQNYEKKIALTTSIQNYIGNIVTDTNKSAFTIDAGLVDFVTFRNFLRDISETEEEKKEDRIDINNQLIVLEYIKKINKIDNKIFKDVNDDKLLKDAKTCIINILYLYLIDNSISENISPTDYPNFFKKIFANEKARYSKQGCKNNYTERFIANILNRLGQKISSDTYEGLQDKINPDLFNVDSQNKVVGDIIKLFIQHSKKYLKDIERGATEIIKELGKIKNCKGDIMATELKPEKLIRKTFEPLEVPNEEFKIISPQKFDSNRTTGGSWDKTTIDDILYINDCNTDQEKINDNYKINCSFKVLNDTCYFYSSGQQSNKDFIFEIDNENYPIKKIFVSSPDKFKDYTTGVIYLLSDNFRYNKVTKTLYCKNAPGVTELVEIYKDFTSNGTKNVENVLNNILTIKRAGDYSQIWFCQKYNNSNPPNKVSFMSNDRMSASFCLLEKVPFVCLIRNYGVYYNPDKQYEAKNLYDQFNQDANNMNINNKNNIIMNNFINNCVGDKKVLINYLTFIRNNKDKSTTTYISKYKILSYMDKIIDHQRRLDMDEIDMTSDDIIPPNIKTESNNSDDILYNIYNNIIQRTNITENVITNTCTAEVLNKIIDIFGLQNKKFKTAEYTREDSETMEDAEEKKIKESLFLRGIKEVKFPGGDDQDIITKALTALPQTDQNIFSCKPNILYSTITSLVAKYQNFKNLQNLQDNPLFYNDYIYNYNNLLFCLKQIYESTTNIKLKEAIEYVLPDEEFTTYDTDLTMSSSSSSSSSFQFSNIKREHFGFSFENGLTYYHIYPDAPSTINMNKYNNANNVYIADKKGMMKVENHKSNSKIHINKASLKESKSKEYTDGTKLSYYRF